MKRGARLGIVCQVFRRAEEKVGPPTNLPAAGLRFIRRLGRDVRERGRTVESVVRQYLATIRPIFIEPSKRHADAIIPEGGYNGVGIDLVIQKIRSLVGAGEGPD